MGHFPFSQLSAVFVCHLLVLIIAQRKWPFSVLFEYYSSFLFTALSGVWKEKTIEVIWNLHLWEGTNNFWEREGNSSAEMHVYLALILALIRFRKENKVKKGNDIIILQLVTWESICEERESDNLVCFTYLLSLSENIEIQRWMEQRRNSYNPSYALPARGHKVDKRINR